MFGEERMEKDYAKMALRAGEEGVSEQSLQFSGNNSDYRLALL